MTAKSQKTIKADKRATALRNNLRKRKEKQKQATQSNSQSDSKSKNDDTKS